MGRMNHCRDGGYLVGGDGEVGEDAAEFYGPGYPVVLGCSSLVCETCGWPVRSIAGVVPVVGTDAARIYEQADWEHAPELPKDDPGSVRRFYSCRCVLWIERDERALHPEDPEPDALAFPWACSGHELLQLPAEIDGVRIDEGTLEGLVRDAFLRGAPPSARGGERASAVGWASKVFVRLTGTRLVRPFASAVARALVDPERRVRACALLFFLAFPDAPEAERVSEVARDRPELFGAEPDPTLPESTLEARLMAAIGARLAEDDPAVLAVARREAFRPGPRERLLIGLCEYDGDWVAAHIADAGSVEGRWQELLSACVYAESPRLGELAARVVAASLADAEAVKAFASTAFRWSPAAQVEEGVDRFVAHGYVIPGGDARTALLGGADPVDLVRAWSEADLPRRERMRKHLCQLVFDETPDVRAGAIAFFRSLPEVPDAGALVRALGDERLASIPDRHVKRRRSLRESVVDALCARLREGESAVLPALRDEALRPKRAIPVLRSLLAEDERWTTEHASAIAIASPGALGEMLRLLHKAGKPVRDVVADVNRRIPPNEVRKAIAHAIPAGPARDEALTLVPSR